MITYTFFFFGGGGVPYYNYRIVYTQNLFLIIKARIVFSDTPRSLTRQLPAGLQRQEKAMNFILDTRWRFGKLFSFPLWFL